MAHKSDRAVDLDLEFNEWAVEARRALSAIEVVIERTKAVRHGLQPPVPQLQKIGFKQETGCNHALAIT